MRTLRAVVSTVILLLVLAACAGLTPSPALPQSPVPAQPTPASPSTIPPSTTSSATGTLTVHFIDVGQGDSILLDLGQTEVLIDGGEKSPGVVDYLKKYVDGPLELVVATHPHSDHIGGLPAILNAFQVQQIWYNGEKSDTKSYTDFMAAVQAEGAEVHIGKRGDKITAGPLSFAVRSPFNLSGTTNNNSIVLSLTYSKVGFLFTGDAEKEAEGVMLLASDIPVPRVDVLKVGHHGSRTASSPDFLAAAHPSIAVYSAGVGNSYGHPHQETLSALAQIGAKVYGTDRSGTIRVVTEGNTFTVQTAR